MRRSFGIAEWPDSIRSVELDYSNPAFSRDLHLQRVHLAAIRFVVVPEGVEDSVEDQVADFGGQRMLLIRRPGGGPGRWR